MAEQKVKLTELPAATDTIDTAQLLVNQNSTDQKIQVTHFLRSKNNLSDLVDSDQARANLNVPSVDEVNDKLSGYIKGSLSFSAGGSLASRTDFIWDEESKAWYYWSGTLPKDVPAASTPDSTGGIGAGKWVQVGDLILTEKIDRALFNNFIYNFGGIPDYTGAPLYDGNDASRITATDNTPMLLNALTNGIIKNNVLRIHIPAGHYGFSGDKIILDPTTLPYKKIIISGEGEGVTILDYIKEDNTGTGNTEQGDNAKELLRFEVGFDHVEFQNITLKCTTKTGFVNGTPSSDPSNWAIYNGTIWFAHIKQAKKVVLRSVTTEHGNYRCLSIDGISETSPGVTELEMHDCTGRYNTGSGFWLRGIKKSRIFNCYCYRNGNKGVTATGYGITFSQYCSDIIIQGGAYYENYRKGVDKHGGIGNITMKDVLIADNIMFQTSFDHQYLGLYPGDVMTDMQLSNVDIEFGRNPDFCNEALSAIDLTFRNHISIVLNDKLINGSTAGRLRQVRAKDCSIKYLQGVTVPFNTYVCISEMAQEALLDNVSVDVRALQLDRTGNKDVYTLTTIGIGADNATLNIHGGQYLTADGLVRDLNGNNSNSLFIGAKANSKIIIGGSAEFDLVNHVLLGSTGSGRAFEYTGQRKIDDCSFKVRNLQNVTHQFSTGAGLAWLENGFFFGNAANQINYGGAVALGFGDCHNMTQHKFGVHDRGVTFKIDNSKLQAGTPCNILTANLYGNMNLRLEGRCARSPDIYEARWLGSANTFQVVVGSDRISSGITTDQAIQWNGNNTNLIAKKITLNTTTSLSASEYYVAEISANNNFTVKYLGTL
ncbi:tail fiber/spike domain-containing protein [Enterobacter cloacae]|uniref:tail fiber/spike domain-containing protein n=1 Tax=Enterobacter cloacae TaxID=550 RepID=UPI0039848102